MIYLDNAATTKVYKKIIHLINYYNTEMFFNPLATYDLAVKVYSDIEDSRKFIADVIGANSQEIIFTSCGSESNNTAIFGSVKNVASKYITCETEHLATYNCFLALKSKGYNVEFCKSNFKAGVDANNLLSMINQDTRLVSIMHINNETGFVNDVKCISREIKKINKNCIVHVDGVQAFCKIDFDVSDTDIDAYSFSGHKIGAPKGIGGLFVKKGVNIHPAIYGGGQEHSMRSGTHNVAGIMAFKEAANLALQSSFNVRNIKQIIYNEICSNIDDVVLNSPFDVCSDYILNLSIKSIKSEILQNYLQNDGIYIGLGSACSSRFKNDRISKSLHLEKVYTDGTIRLSFFDEISESDAKFVAQRICHYTQKIREMK